MNNQNSKYGKLTALRKLLRINSTLKKIPNNNNKDTKTHTQNPNPLKNMRM